MDSKRKALTLEPDYRKPVLKLVPKGNSKTGLNRQFRDIIASYIGYPSERAVVDQSTLALVQAAALQYKHPKTRVLTFPVPARVDLPLAASIAGPAATPAESRAKVSAAASDNRGQEVTP